MKRKPNQLHGIRIEFQQHERDLIEQYATMKVGADFIASLFDSLTKMPIENMYAVLTLAEAFGWVDTPIPTITDAGEMAAAFVSWVKNLQDWGGETEAPPDDPAYHAPPPEETYTPIGTDPRTSNYDENYDPTDPTDRYTTNPYTGEDL